MKFKKQYLLDRLHNCDYEEDFHNDSSRWFEYRTMVFEHEGKYYGAHYSVGLTELQDERPFESDPDEIECPEYKLEPIPTWVMVG